MRLFLDECLSPAIVPAITAEGSHLVVHPRDIGRQGLPDHVQWAWTLEAGAVLVTENARDFRRLAGSTTLHPGLIVLPQLSRVQSIALLAKALLWLEAEASRRVERPEDMLVNHVMDISADGAITLTPLAQI